MIYPIALDAVKRLDALFSIERAVNGSPAAERLVVRQELSAPLMAELRTWLTGQRAKLSRNHDLTKAINYMLRRWEAFTRFLGDGRVCLSNNAAEREYDQKIRRALAVAPSPVRATLAAFISSEASGPTVLAS